MTIQGGGLKPLNTLLQNQQQRVQQQTAPPQNLQQIPPNYQQTQPVQQPVYQQPVQQPVYQQPTPQPVQQPQTAASYSQGDHLIVQQLPAQDGQQANAMMMQYHNNNRVELAVQDRNQGFIALSYDKVVLAEIQQKFGAEFAQELARFDANGDGLIYEQELKGASNGNQMPVKVDKFETVASGALGGAFVGGLSNKVGNWGGKLGKFVGDKIGGKVGGVIGGAKGWMVSAVVGGTAGAIGGYLKYRSDVKGNDQQPTPINGYRPDTGWNQNGLVKGMY